MFRNKLQQVRVRVSSFSKIKGFTFRLYLNKGARETRRAILSAIERVTAAMGEPNSAARVAAAGTRAAATPRRGVTTPLTWLAQL